jgi:hypothetical protein
VEAQDAYAAVKVIDGAWKWEPDDVTYWREDQRRSFKPGLARLRGFAGFPMRKSLIFNVTV